MPELLAPCGIDCGQCKAYAATRADDQEALAEMARRNAERHGREFSVEDVTCEGCVGGGERRIPYTRECPIRACALERQLANCGLCGDFACPKVNFILERSPDARATLEEIRGRR